ncbi:MAG: class I SAM-dependent methyltransferase [Deltaproteobacteria bacterium]|nr:class I SAM-dependent methyltransferase [Deltaproteobacteria bacterium]
MKPDPAEFWNTRYAAPGFAYGEAPNDFLVEVADRIPAGPVLCLAEGEGRNAVFLAKRGHAVTAVDLSSVGLGKAKASAERAGVALTTVVANLASWPMPERAFAGVISIWAHLPTPERAALHARVARALVPGGVFVLEAYRPGQEQRGTGGPPNVELLMRAQELREELTGLEVVIAREVTRAIHEGQYHQGDSDVVQVLARRAAP